MNKEPVSRTQVTMSTIGLDVSLSMDDDLIKIQPAKPGLPGSTHLYRHSSVPNGMGLLREVPKTFTTFAPSQGQRDQNQEQTNQATNQPTNKPSQYQYDLNAALLMILAPQLEKLGTSDQKKQVNSR